MNRNLRSLYTIVIYFDKCQRKLCDDKKKVLYIKVTRQPGGQLDMV